MDGTRIWVYDKTTDAVALRPIRDTAVIGNYYTIRTASGPDDGLERIFGKIEAAASAVISRLCDEDGPRFEVSLTDRFALAMYLGLLYSRVPASRGNAQQVAEYLATVTLDMNLAHAEGFPGQAREAGLEGSDEELEARRLEFLDGLRSSSFRVQAPEAVTIDSVLIGLKELPPYIASMGWWLLKRSSWPFYIVGDAPVTVWPSSRHPQYLGVGFATEDAEVSVPLDPETLLVMGHNMPDGYLFHEERLPGVPWWHHPWPYHYRTWSKADRFVLASGRADLQAIQFMLSGAERTRSGTGMAVRGGPEEWRRYAKSEE